MVQSHEWTSALTSRVTPNTTNGNHRFIAFTLVVGLICYSWSVRQ